MKKTKDESNRRDFLQKCGLSNASLLLPITSLQSISPIEKSNEPTNEPKTSINFIYDGLALTPQDYLEKLAQIDKNKDIVPDFYGNGGTTKQLEEEFAKITGKEKAIYLPSGTIANQLAIKLLNENNTKVIVPENSHIFRDEADAAQSVHAKRLVPIGKGKSHFDLADLKDEIAYLSDKEVFKSGLGTVVIENPVRRADGTFVPIETIKDISKYCKENNYKMHLDGARIHLASAFSNISVSEYASYFDTVYISLYKYLNAAGGAILCGDAKIIDQISHQIKIHGGTVFQSWMNTSVALHYLDEITERWQEVIKTSSSIISELNKIDGVTISSLKNGTNIYDLKLDEKINPKKLASFLRDNYNLWLGRANEKGIVRFTVNESILARDYYDIVDALKEGIEHAHI